MLLFNPKILMENDRRTKELLKSLTQSRKLVFQSAILNYTFGIVLVNKVSETDYEKPKEIEYLYSQRVEELPLKINTELQKNIENKLITGFVFTNKNNIPNYNFYKVNRDEELKRVEKDQNFKYLIDKKILMYGN